MNPVISYNDFLNFMRCSLNNQNKLIPVILIKPSTVLYLNSEYHLDHIFDYFDRRTGKDIQFFLPGYSHYPSTSFSEILPNVRPYNKKAIALRVNRLNEIYYSDNDFVSFIELLEENVPSFRYYGHTELLFIKYISSTEDNLGRLDFNKFYRFNLSQIYYSNNHGYRDIEIILEEVLHLIREIKDEDELIKRIKSIFD